MATEGRRKGGRERPTRLLLPVLLVVACRAQTADMSGIAEVALPPVAANVSVDRAVATTGDLITYRVELDYDPDYEVELPEPGADIAGFRIVDLGRERPREVNGRKVEERWYELRADLVGSYVLPPITVTYRPREPAADAEGDERPAETLTTSEIFVEVESVLPADGEAADIRDIKPLRAISDPFPWPWVAAGGAGLLLLAGLGFWIWRRRRQPALAPSAPPHELAFAALDRLRETDFSDPEAVRRYYFALSEVVRIYVEGRFSLNATDLTTEEILARLGDVEGLADSDAIELGSFLRATDEVKFAARSPSEEEIENSYEQALGFVERTRPQTEPEPELRREAA